MWVVEVVAQTSIPYTLHPTPYPDPVTQPESLHARHRDVVAQHHHPQTVHALLGVATPGGYVVFVGSAGRLAVDLVEPISGVHFIAFNPPDDVEPSSSVSVVRGPVPVPLRTSMARGVVVGREYAIEPWLTEASRILLKGLRMVVLRDDVTVPGVQRLALGEGVWVGIRG